MSPNDLTPNCIWRSASSGQHRARRERQGEAAVLRWKVVLWHPHRVVTEAFTIGAHRLLGPLMLGKRRLTAAVDAVGQVERRADVARPE
jgi:hypothetical protein